MKLRLRFQKCTKVLTIEQDRENSFTVSHLRIAASELFANAPSGETNLSLNNKDTLEDDSKLLSDFDIVSGDLVYIVSETNPGIVGDSQQKPQLLNSTQKVLSSTQNSVSSQSRSTYGNQAGANNISGSGFNNGDDRDGVAMETNSKTDLDPAQPGTSSGATADLAMEMEGAHPGTSSGATADLAMEMEGVPEKHIDHAIVNQCLCEPILCREATAGSVPSLLREVYEASQPTDEMEALCVVLHVLMVETGFIIHPEPTSSGHSSVPDRWRYPGYNKFTYTYSGCTDVTCCITILSTGSSVTVHGKVSGNNGATRMCSLRSKEYIQRLSKDCSTCYSQLAKLSRVFKDSIANPLVHDIRLAAGLDDIFGLLALTQEIKLRILSFLDIRSLLRTSQVNTELGEVSKDPYLWRRHYLKDFGNRRDNSLSQDWRRMYIQEYKARKERRKLMSRMTMITPPTWGPQNPFSGPSNWIPPGPGGIIGGDYDLYPNFPSSLPGVPGRLGPRPPMLPRPRYDLIGPHPDLDPGPDPGLIPRRPGAGQRGRYNPFGGMGPRFF